jgi:hypothetical protein
MGISNTQSQVGEADSHPLANALPASLKKENN